MQLKSQYYESNVEKELLQRLKNSDHAAFELVYHAYKQRIIFNLLRVLKSRDLVEEVVQDLFLKVWNTREQIDLDKSFNAFLYTIAANMAKNVFRKAAYDKKIRSQLLPIEKHIYTHIEEEIESQEIQTTVNNLLNLLPPQRRIVFRLCKLEGKSYKEVSELLNISENTVGDHIKKANLTLKQYDKNSKAFYFLIILPLISCY